MISRTDNGIQSHSLLDNYVSVATSFRLVCLINVPHSTDGPQAVRSDDYSCQITQTLHKLFSNMIIHKTQGLNRHSRLRPALCKLSTTVTGVLLL